MKKKKLLNISILTSILFFSACSTTHENLKKKVEPTNVSLYNIMGITEPVISYSAPIDNNRAVIVAKSQPYTLPEYTAPIQKPMPSYAPPPYQAINIPVQHEFVQDIEYISYGRPQVNQFNNYQPREPQVAINSYQMVKDLESKAKSFLGTPYVWGATGPTKFDCSGFTQWVYRDVGINIPRVSKDQARVGKFVKFNELKAGDMMFFDTHKRRTGRVSHVGIYLGDGNFIHASSAGKKVVIYNFNQKEFYKKRFLWGRRVIKDNLHYASN